MIKEASLVLDVGGTNVTGIGISAEVQTIGNVIEIASPSDRDAPTVIRELGNVLLDISGLVERHGYKSIVCGIAIPNPFDYENGVSLMDHKFASLKNKNIKHPLEERLHLPVHFLNDADAFSLGASWKEHPEAKRLVGVTIGTGLGSGFIEKGQFIIKDERIPPNGEIWDMRYKQGIAEDAVSGRSIVARYRELTGASKDPKEIERLARKGNEESRRTYTQLGVALGDILARVCVNFPPDKIVVGGKISHAFDLFGHAAKDTFHNHTGYSTDFVAAKSNHLALFGAAKFALHQSEVSTSNT